MGGLVRSISSLVMHATAFDFLPAVVQQQQAVGHYVVGIILTNVRQDESDNLMALVFDNAPNALARMHKIKSLIDVL